MDSKTITPPAEEQFIVEATEFIEAPDMWKLADQVIAKHSDRFSFLGQFEITYLWRRDGGKSQGEDVWSFCNKVTGLARHFSGMNFVIWFAANHLREAHLGPEQYEALVFHELMHIDCDEKGKPIVRGHDFEGFRAEIEQYGFWQEHLRLMKSTVQGRLFEDDGKPKPTSTGLMEGVMAEVAREVNSGAMDGDGMTVRAWVGGPAHDPELVAAGRGGAE